MAAEGSMGTVRAPIGRAPVATGERLMNDGDKLALSTRMYVRLRHCTGRLTDAMWMANNAEYAREVLRLARSSGDDELRHMADRFEEVVLGVRPKPQQQPVYVEESFPDTPVPALAGKYTGTLR